MDLSKLSDADLEALQKGDLTKLSDDGLAALHGEQKAPAPPVNKSQSGDTPRNMHGYAEWATGHPSDYQPTPQDIEDKRIRNSMMEGIMGNAAGEAAAPFVKWAASPLTKFLGNAAERSGVLSKVKAGVGLARYAKDEISGALDNYNKKAIAPESDKLKSFLTGKQVSVKPESIEGVNPLLNRYSRYLKNSSGLDEMGLRSEETPASATAMNRVKQIASKEADYAKSKPFSEGSEAKAEQAGSVANYARGKVSELGPEVDEANRQLQDMIQTRNRIKEMSDSSPIEALSGTPGTTKSSLLADIDKGAGSNLGQLGENINLARTRLGERGMPTSMSSLASQALGVAPRIGGAAAQGLDKLAEFLGKYTTAGPASASVNLSSRPFLRNSQE